MDSMIMSISNVGIMVVLSAVLIIYMRKVLDQNTEQSKKIFDKFMESTEHTMEKEDKSKEYDVQINAILKTLLHDTDASRVFVLEYHNGGSNLHGRSFLRMTMTNELVRQSIAPMITSFTNQLRSSFLYPITQIEKEGYFSARTIDYLETADYATYIFLKDRDVKSCYLVPIKVDNRIVGIVGIEYITDSPNVSFDQAKDLTKKTTIAIETLAKIN